MGIPTQRHLKAPRLPALGARTVILLASLATGRPRRQHQAAHLLADCGFRETMLDRSSTAARALFQVKSATGIALQPEPTRVGR
ncbi:hypothetical protein [Kitasatospora sp. NPDC056731]|uniref:hypothetical protein n=1 Tax=Kitasatospora sp. NPDC056731 TaxID=3155422 RepID=UPI00342A412B